MKSENSNGNGSAFFLVLMRGKQSPYRERQANGFSKIVFDFLLTSKMLWFNIRASLGKRQRFGLGKRKKKRLDFKYGLV